MTRGYLGLEVKVGQAGRGTPDDEVRVAFHATIARLSCQASGLAGMARIPAPFTLGIDYGTMEESPGTIVGLLQDGVRDALSQGEQELGLLIIDMTSNKFREVRDSFYVHIARALDRMFEENNDLQVLLLLPGMLGDEQKSVSDHVADQLRVRRGANLTVVKVPRDLITRAQGLGNKWTALLADVPRGGGWLMQLRSMSRRVGCVLIDEFNGSGRTYATLHALLDEMRIPAVCYFPLVDRDCGPENRKKYRCDKLSLYELYGPRPTLENVIAPGTSGE